MTVALLMIATILLSIKTTIQSRRLVRLETGLALMASHIDKNHEIFKSSILGLVETMQLQFDSSKAVGEAVCQLAGDLGYAVTGDPEGEPVEGKLLSFPTATKDGDE
ncbi:hypothetical protein AX777_05820 [Sphingobium yanoikuyae]|uniref:Uncharacterized protein n=1 Tax=Sphingobium yanoikuyae TaxID=13690 RepID=A0A177JPM4_SPHYA|nr:hypothetical protein [Sphingobium yanoikuyae]OAH42754.1 hypothetical protein AX777_05820 [Sphingobium yanoikuyae]